MFNRNFNNRNQSQNFFCYYKSLITVTESDFSESLLKNQLDFVFIL